MRILHIQKIKKGIGGSERHLLALLPAFAQRGFDVHMCVLAADEYLQFVAPLRAKGVETTVIPAGPDLNPFLVGRLARQLRDVRPDLVHTHLIHGDLYGQSAASLARIPAVSSIHETAAFARRGPIRVMFSAAHRAARRTIAISRYVRTYIERHHLAPLHRVRVIHYGIDVRDWSFSEADRAAGRRRFGLADEDFAVGVASRLVPGKGHQVVLDAMASIMRRAPQARLLIAGDGPLRIQLQQRALGLPDRTVRFLGHVEDVGTFMTACDVLVFPTLPQLGEGFGLAALEAMAAARPVVASAVTSLPELVVDGETGFLVAPGDAEQLAERVVALAADDDQRSSMGERGRKVAEQSFGLTAMVDSTSAVYRDVLGASGR